jgi:hypothetical protein
LSGLREDATLGEFFENLKQRSINPLRATRSQLNADRDAAAAGSKDLE